jgi:uncharacterized protein involved in type VI secretion and phage assembly
MAGKDRGLVILPEVGTEVILGFGRGGNAFVLGGVYNGADDPPSYANEDQKNNIRRFWSRNSHQIDFDDTSGKERIGILATSESKAVDIDLDASKKVLTVKVLKDLQVEATETISLKCKDFTLEGSMSVEAKGDSTGVWGAGTSADVKATMISMSASTTDFKTSGETPESALATPPHTHPPVK